MVAVKKRTRTAEADFFANSEPLQPVCTIMQARRRKAHGGASDGE